MAKDKAAIRGAAKNALPTPAVGEKKRLVSLDAFRGLTILSMLLVNNAAMDTATPRHFTHAEWSGQINFADVVFPWFLFIVGVAIPFARKPPILGHTRKAIVRAGLLMAFGCLVDSVVARQPVFGLGVLQLIGLAYLCGALLSWFPVWARLLSAALLLWTHALILWKFPVPGVPLGTMTETSNAIDYINRQFLAPIQLKGLLSVLPTTALVCLGSITGEFLRWEKKSKTGSIWYPLLQAAVLIVAGAGIAYGGFYWAKTGTMPLNKPLWTGSYILACGGLGMCMLGAIHLITDGPIARLGRILAYPLIVPGTNPIFAYVAPIVVKILVLQTVLWPLRWPLTQGAGETLEQALKSSLFQQMDRATGGWAYTLGYIAVWWVVLWLLNRKKWYLRV